MILKNEFLVDASVVRVWGLLDELENVIPCIPGAVYIGPDGDDHKVSIKAKIGAISSHFKGTVRFLEKDESKHNVVIHGIGKDLGGKASAVATIVARLEALSPDRTSVVVETDLAITGRLAQFGGGVIADISAQMISQFTNNLHRAIIARSDVAGVPETPNATASDSETNTDKATVSGFETKTYKAIAADAPAALDLGSLMGPIVLRYALKYVVLPVALIAIGWLLGKFVF